MSDNKIVGGVPKWGRLGTGQNQDEPDPSALPAGSSVGAYITEAVLGSGGFGITYRVRHATLNKQFALKEYFPRQFSYREQTRVQPTTSSGGEYAWGLDRFVQEARLVAKFKHPAIVEVSDIFTANNTAYMVLAHEQAPSLDKWLDALGRPPTQDELDCIVGPLLDALELVHGHDMLHRDIAPDNILVRSDGTPVLIDFGSARDDLQHRVGPITAVIKPGYSPPEQYEASPSRQGPWSDIYGLGATLYYAVVGALPVDSEERFDARVRTEAARRARGFYRTGFLAAIDWAMEFQPQARPQTVGEWRTRLLSSDTLQAPMQKGGHAVNAVGPTVRLRRPLAIKMAGISAVLAVCLLAVPAVILRCDLFGWGCYTHTSGPRPLRLEIALPKKSYAVGDNLTFSLRSNRDCYFMVYTVSPTGEVEQHDPTLNEIFMGSPMLKADQWRQLPMVGYATIKPPPGNFELGAVCSKEPLLNVGLNEARLREPARGGRRSFSFALENATKATNNAEIARTTEVYEVHQ
jgi:serine/threonine protein kinase